MKIRHCVALLLATTVCGLTPAMAQAPLTVHYDFGVGEEFFHGGTYDAGSTMLLYNVGTELSWASRISGLTFVAGAQVERHDLMGTVHQPLQNTPFIPVVSAPAQASRAQMPDLAGLRTTVGARYAVTSTIALGAGAGIGYVDSRAQDGPGGSRVRYTRLDFEYGQAERVSLVVRGEQIDLMDFGGEYLRARPVSLLMRVR